MAEDRSADRPAGRREPESRAAAREERGFFEVALAQRAYRALLPDPVDERLIERILDAATHAPSAEDRQPWVFLVVRDPAVRAEIGALAGRLWRDVAREHVRDRISERLLADVEHWATGGLAAAPVIVVVCGDSSATDPRSLAASVYPATQNLCLAAQALGLGSLFSTLPTVSADLCALLALPDHLSPMAVVPIGHPARRLRPPRRISFREKSFRERYGAPW